MSVFVLGLLFGGVSVDQAAPPAPPIPRLISVTMVGKARRAQPTASLLQLFSADDYPVEALRKEEQGTVTARMNIGLTGKLESCSIEQSSGSAALDSTTCNILTQGAEFIPALDEHGKPKTDSYLQRVSWRLPKFTLATSDELYRVIVAVDGAGRATGCKAEYEGANEAAKATGPSEATLAMLCGPMQQLIDRYAELNPGVSQGKYAEIIFDRRRYFPSTDYPKWQMVGGASEVFGDDRSRIEINPDGTVGKCEFLGHIGPAPTMPLCAIPRREDFVSLSPTEPQIVRVGFEQATVTLVRRQ